ncbi:phosphate acetyltransferase [Candidatus Micrarchaeota archaeon]|nr:phosphate acetyltransferase [Candidatus Micrarchaeota archaeon]
MGETIISALRRKADGLDKRIIFPEGSDERIIRAAAIAKKDKVARPILVGKENEIRAAARKLGIGLDGFEIIEPSKSKKLVKYASLYSRISRTPARTAMLIAQQPIFYSALALRNGDADGMLGGAVYSSAEFESVCMSVIGLRKGIGIPSSFFIMEIPGYAGGEGGVLLYADASVSPNPLPGCLANIAIATGQSAKELLGWKPRVAMLSFSTKGSAAHPDVEKVAEATEIAKRKAKGKGIIIDGELQADAALVLSTAQKKIKGDIGEVAGKANVLIFPDLDAGNIAYKLTQILAGAKAYGPILQGFRKPLSDLSRGATVEDIVGAITIIAVMAKRWHE